MHHAFGGNDVRFISREEREDFKEDNVRRAAKRNWVSRS
jgi:hypothetical protein